MNTKILLGALLTAGALSLFAAPKAQAIGCVSGAVAGGVAGHVMNHHAVLGAVGGCIAGHEMAKHKKQQEADDLNQQQLNKMHGNPQGNGQ